MHYIQVLCQPRICKADHAYLTYLTLQRQLSHLNGRKLDRRQVYASYNFLQNRVLKRIIRPKREGVWRKLRNEERHNLYFSPVIIRMINSRRMRWVRH
jgi:hypothetical protein